MLDEKVQIEKKRLLAKNMQEEDVDDFCFIMFSKDESPTTAGKNVYEDVAKAKAVVNKGNSEELGESTFALFSKDSVRPNALTQEEKAQTLSAKARQQAHQTMAPSQKVQKILRGIRDENSFEDKLKSVSSGPSDKWQQMTANAPAAPSIAAPSFRSTGASALVVAAEFEGAGEELGVEIWRIMKMKPVRLPENEYGQVYEKDCYLMLHTCAGKGGGTAHVIYYWIGKDSFMDDAASVAIRAVQLGKSVGASHQREEQGEESQEFLDCCSDNNIRLQFKKGGTESGFCHVDLDAYEPRMLRFVGKKKITILQVELSKQELNQSDSFLLDMGKKVWVWNGSKTSKAKMAKALEIGKKIQEEGGGKAEVAIVDEKESFGIEKEFWKPLGGCENLKLPVHSLLGITDEMADQTDTNKFFYIVKEQGTGKVSCDLIEERPWKKEMLDSKASSVLDCETEVYVWCGKFSTFKERNTAMDLAEELIQMFERPSWIPITRIVEHAETCLFRERFTGWVDAAPKSILDKDFQRRQNARIAKKAIQKDIDVKKLYSKRPPKEPPVLKFDRETALLEVWSIDGHSDGVTVPPEQFGIFYEGLSYIVHLLYIDGQKIRSLLFFWEGHHANSKGFITFKFAYYKDLEERVSQIGASNPPEVVRIYQDREPTNFFRVIAEGIIIFNGKEAPTDKKPILLHVCGDSEDALRAVQISLLDASFLRSNNSFLLLTMNTVFVWFGKGSMQHERTFAQKIANRILGGRKLQNIPEGKETSDFWRAIGGKKQYAQMPWLCGFERLKLPVLARAFLCSTITGAFEVAEQCPLYQDCLDDKNTVIIDVWYEVYVWVGKFANRELKDMTLAFANKITTVLPRGTPDDFGGTKLNVIEVQSGKEPPGFKCHFKGWHTVLEKIFEDPYEKRMALRRERARMRRLKWRRAKKRMGVSTEDKVNATYNPFAKRKIAGSLDETAPAAQNALSKRMTLMINRRRSVRTKKQGRTNLEARHNRKRCHARAHRHKAISVALGRGLDLKAYMPNATED